MNWEDSSPWCLPYLWEQKNRPVENFTFWCKIHSSRYLRGLKGMLLIWNHAYSIFVSGCHSQDFNCDCILQLTTTATRFHHINTVLQQSRYLWNVSFASFLLPPATPWCMHGNNDWIVFIWDIREKVITSWSKGRQLLLVYCCLLVNFLAFLSWGWVVNPRLV